MIYFNGNHLVTREFTRKLTTQPERKGHSWIEADEAGAMAADTPDAITLNSWEDAFKYPIPTVRRLEQELRRDAESNRDKLRSLVGYVRVV